MTGGVEEGSKRAITLDDVSEGLEYLTIRVEGVERASHPSRRRTCALRLRGKWSPPASNKRVGEVRLALWRFHKRQIHKRRPGEFPLPELEWPR